jgi:alpha-tubulin suppressor-like RCC1 family protein
LVTDISAGNRHSLLINQNGDVYSFGANSNGQLGINSNIFSTPNPSQITSFSNITFGNIFSCNDFSFVIDSTNNLYGFGKNHVINILKLEGSIGISKHNKL